MIMVDDAFTAGSFGLLRIAAPFVELVVGTMLIWASSRDKRALNDRFEFSRKDKELRVATNGWIVSLVCGCCLVLLPIWHLLMREKEQVKKERAEACRDAIQADIATIIEDAKTARFTIRVKPKFSGKTPSSKGVDYYVALNENGAPGSQYECRYYNGVRVLAIPVAVTEGNPQIVIRARDKTTGETWVSQQDEAGLYEVELRYDGGNRITTLHADNSARSDGH